MVNGHAVTEYTADELGVVPIFGVEFLAKSFYGSLVTTFVLELEIVAFLPVAACVFDD